MLLMLLLLLCGFALAAERHVICPCPLMLPSAVVTGSLTHSLTHPSYFVLLNWAGDFACGGDRLHS